MNRGIKISVCMMMSGMFLTAPVSGTENDTTKTQTTFQKEAYYHFFLEEYLTSATRLKMLEAIFNDGPHPGTLNETRLLLGSLYIAWGMHRPAADLFNHLIERYPSGMDRNQVLLLIERLQYSRGLHGAAVETFKRLAQDKVFSSMDLASYLAGLSHYALGSFDRSAETLQFVPMQSIYYPFAQLTLAKSYLQINQKEKSFETLINLNGRDSHDHPVMSAFSDKIRLTLGYLYLETDQFQEARTVLTSIPKASPFYPDALFALGWAHFHQNLFLDALMIFQDQIALFPDHPFSMEALTAIGHCYTHLGTARKALDAYDVALDAYDDRRRMFKSLRKRIKDPKILDRMIREINQEKETELKPFLTDDTTSFWIRQYNELVQLEDYLTQKLNDIEVFTVLIDHRKKVFKENLPMVRGFLIKDPVMDIKKKGVVLHQKFYRESLDESLLLYAFSAEVESWTHWVRARGKSETIRRTLKKVNDPAMLQEWTRVNRWIEIAQGELFWKIKTEIPGRRDQLQRNMNSLIKTLEQIEEKKQYLMATIPSTQIKLNGFQTDIDGLKPSLQEKRKSVSKMRARVLPPLKDLMIQTLDKKIGKIEKWSSRARFHQIQIVDAGHP